MLRYALYARKSHEDKKLTEKSIKDQVKEWKDSAHQHGLFIARIFEESKSAMKPHQRPFFTEMLELIRKGQIDGILCWHINRLVRNMEEGGLLAQMLVDGVIKEIRTHSAVYRSGDNILPLVMEAASSTQFSLDLRDSVTRGMNSHINMGGWNSKAYQGYRNNRHKDFPKIGVVVPDEERFPLIRKGWDMMLTGAYSPGQVVRTLNKVYGYRTRKTENQGGVPLSRSCAYKLFTNPFYAGFIVYKGRLMKGSHPPMVTEEEFYRVQEYLKRTTKQHAHRHTFSYTGLMQCGYCGLQVTGEEHHRNDTLYLFYRCSDSRSQCNKKGLSEVAIEAEIMRLLDCLHVDPSLGDLAHWNILRSLERKANDQEAVAAQHQRALEAVKKELDNLMDMWLRELLTDAERYRTREKQLEEERNKLMQEAVVCQSEFEKMRTNAYNARSFLRHGRDQFLVADTARKREIAHALGAEYRLFGREKTLTIQVHPLLVEFVHFANEIGDQLSYQKRDTFIGSFEHVITRSQSQQNAHFQTPVLGGRTEEAVFEPPESLLSALRKHLFPDLFAQSLPNRL